MFFKSCQSTMRQLSQEGDYGWSRTQLQMLGSKLRLCEQNKSSSTDPCLFCPSFSVNDKRNLQQLLLSCSKERNKQSNKKTEKKRTELDSVESRCDWWSSPFVQANLQSSRKMDPLFWIFTVSFEVTNQIYPNSRAPKQYLILKYLYLSWFRW